MIHHETWFRRVGVGMGDALSRLERNLSSTNVDSWREYLSHLYRLGMWKEAGVALFYHTSRGVHGPVPHPTAKVMEALAESGHLADMGWRSVISRESESLLDVLYHSRGRLSRTGHLPNGERVFELWRGDVGPALLDFARNLLSSLVPLWSIPAPESVQRALKEGGGFAQAFSDLRDWGDQTAQSPEREYGTPTWWLSRSTQEFMELAHGDRHMNLHLGPSLYHIFSGVKASNTVPDLESRIERAAIEGASA